MRVRVSLWVMAVAAGAGFVLASATLVRAREWSGIPVLVVAGAWFASGFIATRARPDHLSAVSIFGVGSAHLIAFGCVAPLTLAGTRSATWLEWGIALVGAVAFAAGFVCLATLLALYPDGRFTRRLQLLVAVGGAVAAVVIPVVAALTAASVPLVVSVGDMELLPPAPLPMGGGGGIDLFPMFLALVVAGFVVLVIRSRGAQGDRRRQLAWIKAAAVLLVLVIVGTPAGVWAVGETVWSWVAGVSLSLVPFAFLAGLVRLGSLDVDLLAARTIAYAAIVVTTLSAVALIALWVDAASGGAPVAAVAVAVGAAVLGQPLRVRFEWWADRWLSGGRVRGYELVRAFSSTLDDVQAADLPQRTVDTIASGLDVAWVQVRHAGTPLSSFGTRPDGQDPEAWEPLRTSGHDFGTLECGARHGGWSESDRRLLGDLARSAAGAMDRADLARNLEQRVAELEASRARIVHAEAQARRGLERDLHDGVQQQLVAVLVRLTTLRTMIDGDSDAARVADEVHHQARQSLTELRELVQGVHPPALTDHGLVSALRSRVAAMPFPVSLDVDEEAAAARFPADLEGAAYYAACEALTNAVKHSGATEVRVRLEALDQGGLRLVVVDDGCGFIGAERRWSVPSLRDRVEAAGGALEVRSGPGQGTHVTVTFLSPVTTYA